MDINELGNTEGKKRVSSDPMKHINMDFNEKELVLMEAVMLKATSEFAKSYRILSKKRGEESTPEQDKKFIFYRDATLICERLGDRLQKTLKKEGTETYDFSPFEDIMENALKGATDDQ